MRYKYKHSKPTLKKYDCEEHKKKYNEFKSIIKTIDKKKYMDHYDICVELDIHKCWYCGQFYDTGDTRQFHTKDNKIDIACKPCLWLLGARTCACCGEKIFGKGAA